MKISETNVRDLLVKTHIPGGDYVINPYIGCTNGCKYCYAAFMKRFAHTDDSWGNFLIAKRCNKILDPIKLENRTINIGTVTDGYVWQEKDFKITRNILEQLTKVNCHLIILTKNNLVLRDIDLLKQMHDVTVAFSINTTNEQFKQDMDHASPIIDRMNALKQLHNNGIKTAIFVSPIFPEITDWDNIIKQTKEYVDEYWFEDLNLRQPFKGTIIKYIEDKYPKLLPIYNEIYNKGNRTYWRQVSKAIEEFCKSEHVKFINFFHHAQIRKN